MATDETTENIQKYIASISKYPLLSEDEVTDLNEKRLAGCEQAYEKLVVGNLRLVMSIANHYRNLGLPLADLISEGNIGLMKAVKKYDSAKGKLSTYATWWIKQAIRRALSNQARTVRLPVHMVEKVARVRKFTDTLHLELGRPPSSEEISEISGLTKEQVTRTIASAGYTTSLNAAAGPEDESEVGDNIADTTAIDPGEHCERMQMFAILHQTIETLNVREREIIALRFGLTHEAPMTLESIGVKFGVTRERIRQIEASAVKKMQKHMQKARRKLDLNRLIGICDTEEPNLRRLAGISQNR